MSLVEIPPYVASDDIDDEIIEIFMEEVEEVSEELRQNFILWKQNREDKNALQNLRRAFHTLKGSGRLVGATAIGELGWHFEEMLNRVLDRTLQANDNIINLIEQFPTVLDRLLGQFKQHLDIDYPSLVLISQAATYTASKGKTLGEFELEAKLSKNETVTAVAKQEDNGFGNEFLHIFQQEASEHIVKLSHFLQHCYKNPPCYMETSIVRILHTLNGSARTANLVSLGELAAVMETHVKTVEQGHLIFNQAQQILFVESVKMMTELLVKTATDIDQEKYQRLLDNWQKMQQTLLEHPPIKPKQTFDEEQNKDNLSFDLNEDDSNTLIDETEQNNKEDVDEFMQIFLEEAEEILDACQNLVARWQTSPDSMPLLKELQRELHTLKGGARMVGIAAMGDLSHELESVLTQIVEGVARSGARLQNVVQESLDELGSMAESIRNNKPATPDEHLIEKIQWALSQDNQKDKERTETDDSHAENEADIATVIAENEKVQTSLESQLSKHANLPPHEEERIRVRASLIDKLTNLSGELAISRAHMEQQQGAFKNNLEEMGNTIMRLRDQLRRFEIETEAQIMSHYADNHVADDEEFDPLELDRFSVLQQLSRSLMESVSDLLNIEEGLNNQTRRNENLLIQQTHIGAELQEGVMRTRMIPFSQVTPRLQRIARLTARELNKNIDFVIENDDIEFERTILNRIVAPLEHMLRNAIGHGVEEIQERQKTNKPSLAMVKLNLHKEGAELILTLSDDGRGLDLTAIRQKAVERGLLKSDEKISHSELMQFILKPAFSTVKNITQVSGRGVGMDIANSEIKQLGGALRLQSKAGKGTNFEIRLPLSLTISNSLLVHVAEETLAIPLHNVEAVIRVNRNEVLGDERQQHYRYLHRKYQIVHLGDLLGFSYQSSIDSPVLPMLLVRSGNHQVAILVDGIEGSKELVVKSVGPQLGNIRWIAGATILGDGRVVIILDMLSLVRSATGVELMSMANLNDGQDDDKPRAKVIMVVDDSITVRKVTSRVLKRQNMKVVTAKDGVDAIAQLQDVIPDLMLLDVEMPRMDGFELATQIRNDPVLKHLPIIMITSRTGIKHRERAAKIGINKHLGKPFNETELLENIHALLPE